MLSKVLILSFFVSCAANAQLSRSQFKEVPKGKQMDLLHEGNTLSINQEQTVQRQEAPTTMFATVLFGGFQAKSLTVQSNGHTMNYDLNHYMPLASIQFNHYPLLTKFGKWGWAGSIGYSYSQYQDAASTALHVVPVELNLAYRYEPSSAQKIVPYVMAGPAAWTYFQRGLDQYNSSESKLLGSATAGVAFNLNRLHLVDSRNESEFILQYQRNVGSSGGADFNGNTVQLGGTIAL